MPPARYATYLEVAPKRTFACAVDWPGWARGGRTEAQALEALAAYGARYARVVGEVADFDPPSGIDGLEVVARVDGNASTEFGVPGIVPPQDERPFDGHELDRQRNLLEAAWAALDAAALAASRSVLRKGPRGGGRELPKIIDHVVDAERGYLTALGARRPADDSVEALRSRILEVLSARAEGRPIHDPSQTKKPWPPRYFARRAAWHVLDHAWEIEDRADFSRLG